MGSLAMAGWACWYLIAPVLLFNYASRMSQSIKDILNYFREEASNNRDLGDKFEKLIATFLTKDPLYAERYSNVWLWIKSVPMADFQG
jgi:hypothetical protein